MPHIDVPVLESELRDWQKSAADDKAPAELFDYRELAYDRISEMLKVDL